MQRAKETLLKARDARRFAHSHAAQALTRRSFAMRSPQSPGGLGAYSDSRGALAIRKEARGGCSACADTRSADKQSG